MRALLDACVLYPTVMRQMLLGAAAQGLFRPLWSERILEEWARATERDGGDRVDVDATRRAWPDAIVTPRRSDEDRLVLPDPNDVHVLAAAIAGSADVLITLNARDFPRHTLNAEGVFRQDPDSFLCALWREAPGNLNEVARDVHDAAVSAGAGMSLRELFKRARLPRLAKALAAES